MNRSRIDEQQGTRRSASYHAYYAPVAGIAILLAGWFLITEWQNLPQVITSTMAALP
jgi:hypothetical protein